MYIENKSGGLNGRGDRLYGAPGVDVDEDVRMEYWTKIRHQPENVDKTSA